MDPLEQALVDAMDVDDLAAIDQTQRALDAADQATRDRLATPGALRAAALYYARRNWKVFPCGVGQKRPGIPSPHPQGSPERQNCKGECGLDGHGLHDATTDPAKVAAWWKGNPNFNIGLATGHTFDVIDIDGQRGMESLRQFMRAAVPDDPDDALGHKWTNTDDILPPKLGTVLTPRHPGVHYYIAPTGSGNTVGINLPGIDFRGLGGYVLAPPSRTEHGTYTWVTPVHEGTA